MAISLQLLFSTVALCAGASTLAIVNAGVHAADGGPFVASDYEFLPGDTVYVTFQVAGFDIDTDDQDDTRSIALSYTIVPQDESGVELAEPVTGKIDEGISDQDKRWQPLRRASFVLPDHLLAGSFEVKITVSDQIAHTTATQPLPFQVGGLNVHADRLSIVNFRFARDEDGSHPLKLAAFSAGDTVFARFNMVGFEHGPRNSYDVSYGISVKRPDGKPFVDDPNVGVLKGDSFYPAQVLSGTLAITTPAKSARGRYLVQVLVHDNVAQQSATAAYSFTLE